MNQRQSHDLIPFIQLDEHARLFRLLSNPQRVRILDFLDTAACPQRVTEIVKVSEGVVQAIVSQQLRILKNHGIVDSTRNGTQVFYQIISPEMRHYLTVLRESGV
jgi:DNA-binding transcriptional ArsR family regulator